MPINLSSKEKIALVAVMSLGLGVGLKIIPSIIVLLLFGFAVLATLINYLKGHKLKWVSYLIILAFLEPYMRTYHFVVPYLAIQYFIILIGLHTLINGKHTIQKYSGLAIFGIFLLLEVLNAVRYIQFRHTTLIITQTACMFFCLYLGSKVRLNRVETEKLFKVILFSGLFITAFISAVYLTGRIEWTSVSNFKTSGGMGPVQISFYLAISSFAAFYFSFNSKNTWRIFFFGIAAYIVVIMVLTFSRGGIYMLGIMIIVFFAFQRTKKFILPLLFFGVFIYYGFDLVTNVTQGKIVERYQQKGASNRELLFKFGWDMFLENPIMGLGTANYYFEVSKSKYLGMVSGAHNEFIRAFSEHGFLGGVLWSLFFISYIIRFIKTKKSFFLQISLAFFLVFLASTFHNGLKLSLQPIILLIAVATIPEYENNKSRKTVTNVLEDEVVQT